MRKSKLFKQSKPRPKMGALQVQLSTTMGYYVVYINLTFMGMMFWHTTAAPWFRMYYAGAMLWQFALFMILLVAAIMVFDWKFVYPSRQASLSQQSYKHDNPAVQDLQAIRKETAKIAEMESDIKEIKKTLEKMK